MYKFTVVFCALCAGINGANATENEDQNLKQDCAIFFRKDYSYLKSQDSFYKLHRVRAKFKVAVLRCRLEGSKLFMPKTKAIANEMLGIVRDKHFDYKGSYLVGFHATISEGDYFTLDGEPLYDLVEWKDEVQFTNDSSIAGGSYSCVNLDQEARLVGADCEASFPFVCLHPRNQSVMYTQCGPSNNGYEFYEETKYCYKFHTIPRHYSKAFMACAAEGAKLVNIESDVEKAVIAAIYTKNPDSTMFGPFWKKCAFVGISDWGEPGDWVTNEGNPLSTTGWKFRSSEPNNSTDGEFCGGTYNNGELNDLWCDRVSPFICKMVPNALKC